LILSKHISFSSRTPITTRLHHYMSPIGITIGNRHLRAPGHINTEGNIAAEYKDITWIGKPIFMYAMQQVLVGGVNAMGEYLKELTISQLPAFMKTNIRWIGGPGGFPWVDIVLLTIEIEIMSQIV